MSRQDNGSIGMTLVCALGTVSWATQTSGTDNRDGRWVLLEEGPVHPMELSSDGQSLWVANIADATVSVVQLSNAAIIEELGAARGPVTVRARPGEDEMWVVCQSSGTVLVYQASTRKLLDGVNPAPLVSGLRIGGEPCGLEFSADGSKAYVTLGVSDQIVSIDAATRVPGTPFDFASPFVPVTSTSSRVQEPRALTLVGSTLYVLSFESGNGTIPFVEESTLSSTIRDMWADFASTLIAYPPPDRDVLSFDVSSGTPTGATALWRMGTINFDIKKRPGQSTLYVSNVDLHNTLVGEHQFSVGGNSIASHRVTYATPWNGTSTPPQTTSDIDLNVDKVTALSGERFAAPNEMVFNAAGTRLYVACYESKTTAVIDVANDLVIASLQSSGAGPRGVVLKESAGLLYVYNRADHTVDEFDVSSLSSGTIATPARTFSAGYDGTPYTIRQGRKHHIDAANSANQLQSCNSCHTDGHFDRLAWDLGEFTGPLAPPNPQPVDKDTKGVKTTMSLRGIEETPPFHWRGDRADLVDFNGAFAGLLGGAELADNEFAAFQEFIFSLSYPPNPGQRALRELGTTAATGKGHFTGFANVDRALISVDPVVNQFMLCVECHSLDGFSGTNNQVNSDLPGNVSQNIPALFADDAMQLRGLFDKESDLITYPGPIYPSPPHPNISTLTSAPWAFANSGAFRSLSTFLDAFPALSSQQQDEVVQFLAEFDTGLAPCTTFAWTLNQAVAGTPTSSPVPRFLLPQRTAGNCDVVARGWTVDGNGARVPLRMDFDAGLSKFVTDQPAYGPYTYVQLDQLAVQGNGAFCFFGTPVGNGRRLGRDRDLDFWIDGDEAQYQALSNRTDTDLDGFPDGYEITLGSNPNLSSSIPSDSTPPNISGLTLVWCNSKTAKLRWSTDEESLTKVTVATATGPVAFNQTFQKRGYDKEHVIRVRGLQPGHTYTVTVEARNPANAFQTQALSPNLSTQAHVFDSAHVDYLTLSVLGVQSDGKWNLQAEVKIVDQDQQPLPGATATVKFVEWNSTSGVFVLTGQVTGTTNSQGIATVDYTTQNVGGLSTTVEAILEFVPKIGVQSLQANTLMHFHPLEKSFSDALSF